MNHGHKERGLKLRFINAIKVLALITLFAGFIGVARGQAYQSPYRLNDKQVKQIIRNIEGNAERFRDSLDTALDESRLNGTEREDEVNARVKAFEEATKRLHENFDNRRSAAGDVQTVLDRAARIDEFIYRNRFGGRAESDWARMRSELDRLANAYGVSWRWQRLYPADGNQSVPYRLNDKQVERLLRNSERAANTFRRSLDEALDRSRLDDSAREDNINEFVNDFYEAMKRLRDRFDGHTSIAGDVENVLLRAMRIDDFMRRHPLDRRVQRDWSKLRSGLDQLSQSYNLAWNWNNRP
jgi:hypothetical protein